jgi:hypothetical protein
MFNEKVLENHAVVGLYTLNIYLEFFMKTVTNENAF